MAWSNYFIIKMSSYGSSPGEVWMEPIRFAYIKVGPIDHGVLRGFKQCFQRDDPGGYCKGNKPNSTRLHHTPAPHVAKVGLELKIFLTLPSQEEIHCMHAV